MYNLYDNIILYFDYIFHHSSPLIFHISVNNHKNTISEERPDSIKTFNMIFSFL